MKQKGKRQNPKAMKFHKHDSEIYNKDSNSIDVNSIKNLVDETQKIEDQIKKENGVSR